MGHTTLAERTTRAAALWGGDLGEPKATCGSSLNKSQPPGWRLPGACPPLSAAALPPGPRAPASQRQRCCLGAAGACSLLFWGAGTVPLPKDQVSLNGKLQVSGRRPRGLQAQAWALLVLRSGRPGGSSIFSEDLEHGPLGSGAAAEDPAHPGASSPAPHSRGLGGDRRGTSVFPGHALGPGTHAGFEELRKRGK